MSFWENKNVLITGSTGFVGKHLSKTLTNLGANVSGLARNTSETKSLRTNILNFRKINDFVKNKKIKICFHLAGSALVESGQSDPYNTFKTNVDGTLNVLEIARLNNLEKIIIASTAHVYGNNKVPFLESYTPKPSRPYETSKACTDLIAQSYADAFSLPVLIPRFVNIYGPGDLNFNRLIPKTIKSVLKKESPRMWGGNAQRDYIYIEDVVSAYIKLGELPGSLMDHNRIYNFGTGEVISVRQLIEKIIKLSGNEFHIEKIKKERTNEINLQYVSAEKASKILRWKQKNTLADGLKKTICWYKNYFKTVSAV
jgi:CDP-glucose 4,6-dehydratase